MRFVFIVMLLSLITPLLADELGPIDESLLGVWKQVEPAAETETRIELTQDSLTTVNGDKLEHRSPVIGQKDDTVVITVFCNRVDHQVALDGDRLTITMTPAKNKFRPNPESVTTVYVREEERPAVFDLALLPLGAPDTAIADERLAELRTDLQRRGELDQEVRKPFSSPEGPTEEERNRMIEVDQDNVAFLKELIQEVGWIDAPRFGEEASKAAWFIVQHSGDLALMKTVLPLIKEEVQETGKNGGGYALLYDRSQIWLGEKQRYGSQVFFGPDGMFIAPLEDPENVDERRSELSMEPLESYMKRFVERNDGKPLPIHTEF